MLFVLVLKYLGIMPVKELHNRHRATRSFNRTWYFARLICYFTFIRHLALELINIYVLLAHY
jgi:hypothetical protein